MQLVSVEFHAPPPPSDAELCSSVQLNSVDVPVPPAVERPRGGRKGALAAPKLELDLRRARE